MTTCYGFMRRLGELAYNAYDVIALQALKRLYLRGPGNSMYGFWHGKEPHEVCGMLANSPADFWLKHPVECDAMITDRVQSYVVVVETGVYFFTMYRLLSALGPIVLYSIGSGYRWMTGKNTTHTSTSKPTQQSPTESECSTPR